MEFWDTYHPYFLTGFSVLVSVTLFAFSYKQTVKARIERIRSANSALSRALLRRVVQENYKPQHTELAYLADGFSREYNLRSEELLSTLDMLKIMYAKVTESDLILAERRGEILSRITEGIDQVKAKAPLDAAITAAERPATLLKEQNRLVGILGATTSIAGALAAAFVNRELFSPIVLGAFGASVAVVTVIANLSRVNNRSYASLSADYHHKIKQLEQRVKSLLASYSTEFTGAPSGSVYDFSLTVASQSILVNMKPWDGEIPSYLHRALTSQMESALEKEGATEAWVIVSHKKALPKFLPQAGTVKFLTVADLKKRLADFKQREGV